MLINDFSASKILAHPDKVNNYFAGHEETLVVVEIDLTNKCNANCPRCSDGNTRKGSLSEKEAKNYLLQLKHFGVKGVIFSGGGEPLCSPFADKVISYAKKMGFSVGLNTNGTLLCDKKFDLIDIIESLDFLRVSLDAGNHIMTKKPTGAIRMCLIRYWKTWPL